MNKRKNGFTLIELLVVIVLIISILGIAIVSMNKLSERQKKNAYKKVQEQVLTAGQQYFEVNEYLFDMLDDGSSGVITVKTLVEEDYLNKLTNPITGNALNMCDRVVVTRNDGKFDVRYDEATNNNCEKSVVKVEVFEPGSPKLDVEVTSDTQKISGSSWYTSAVVVTATAKDDGKGPIVKTGRCKDSSCDDVDYNNMPEGNTSKYIDSSTYAADTDIKTTYYRTENIYGKEAKAYIALGVDTKSPNCPDKDALFEYKEIDGTQIQCDPSKSTEKWHCTSMEISLKKNEVKEKNPTDYDEFTYNWESMKYEKEGVYTPKVTITDKAGNASNCSGSDFGIDKTEPTYIKVDKTPIICQVVTSKYQQLKNMLETSFDSSVCDNMFYYKNGAYTGKLSKANEYVAKGGKYTLYIEFTSSDSGSGLVSTKSSNASTKDNWRSRVTHYDKNNNEIPDEMGCSYINNNYPCTWYQEMWVYDRAGNYTYFDNYYSGLSY